MRGRSIVREKEFAGALELKLGFIPLAKAQLSQITNPRRFPFSLRRCSRRRPHGLEESREPVYVSFRVAVNSPTCRDTRGEAFLLTIRQNKQDHLHHGEKPGICLDLDCKHAFVQTLPGMQ